MAQAGAQPAMANNLQQIAVQGAQAVQQYIDQRLAQLQPPGGIQAQGQGLQGQLTAQANIINAINTFAVQSANNTLTLLQNMQAQVNLNSARINAMQTDLAVARNNTRNLANDVARTAAVTHNRLYCQGADRMNSIIVFPIFNGLQLPAQFQGQPRPTRKRHVLTRPIEQIDDMLAWYAQPHGDPAGTPHERREQLLRYVGIVDR